MPSTLVHVLMCCLIGMVTMNGTEIALLPQQAGIHDAVLTPLASGEWEVRTTGSDPYLFVTTADTAIDLAQSDPLLQARAHNVRGRAFQALAEKDASKLRDAEVEFKHALEGDPDSRIADLHFNLAVVLMKQLRDDEGIAELRKELADRANGTTAEESRALIANPRRARETFAPDFSLVSTAGERISLE